MQPRKMVIASVRKSAAAPVAPVKAPPNYAAIVNAVLSAVVIVGACAILQEHWPWLMTWLTENKLVSVFVTSGGIGVALGAFVYLAGDDTKGLIRSWIAARRVRYGVVAALATEIVAAFALQALLSSPRIIRIIPGPQLDLELGDPGQILHIEVDGKTFELASPPPRAMYAGTEERRLHYELRKEDKDARDTAMKDVIFDYYRIDPSDQAGIAKLIRHFTRGDPVLMTSKGAGRAGVPTGTFTDAQHVRPLTVSKVDTHGIETYVAEFQ